MDRYSRNMPALSKADNELLRKKTVAVIGCGGLGGYIIEMLGRLGLGTIIAVDGDVFDVSNLNRQILSEMQALGKSKASQAKIRMEKINPDITVVPIAKNLTTENYKSILSDVHAAIDALDNIKSRLLLESLCEEMNIPLVHGAIGGWFGQVSTILPGDRTLGKIYEGYKNEETKNPLGNLSFTPAMVASLEVSETVKILINKGDLLRNKILFINFLDNDFNIINL